MAPAARSTRSQTPGASSRRRDPTPADAGGSIGHPQSLPPPARRGAETRTRGSLASGSQASGQTGNLARRSPFVPGPPPGRGSSLGSGVTGSRRLFHPWTSAEEGREFRSLQTDPPPPGASHNLYLVLLPRRQTRDTKKKIYRPSGPILQPGVGRKKRKEYIFSPQPDSGIRADPGSKEPRGGPERRGKVGRVRNQPR